MNYRDVPTLVGGGGQPNHHSATFNKLVFTLQSEHNNFTLLWLEGNHHSDLRGHIPGTTRRLSKEDTTAGQILKRAQ